MSDSKFCYDVEFKVETHYEEPIFKKVKAKLNTNNEYEAGDEVNELGLDDLDFKKIVKRVTRRLNGSILMELEQYPPPDIDIKNLAMLKKKWEDADCEIDVSEEFRKEIEEAQAKL